MSKIADRTAPVDDLYERDFFAWTQCQAEALRRAATSGANLPLDWQNIAEEIESLGRSDRRRIRQFAFQIIVHLLKLACSPAEGPRAGWKTEIDEFRRRLGAVLDDSPSLRRVLPDIVAEEMRHAVKAARRDLTARGEMGALTVLAAWTSRSFSADEVLRAYLYPRHDTLAMDDES